MPSVPTHRRETYDRHFKVTLHPSHRLKFSTHSRAFAYQHCRASVNITLSVHHPSRNDRHPDIQTKRSGEGHPDAHNITKILAYWNRGRVRSHYVRPGWSELAVFPVQSVELLAGWGGIFWILMASAQNTLRAVGLGGSLRRTREVVVPSSSRITVLRGWSARGLARDLRATTTRG